MSVASLGSGDGRRAHTLHSFEFFESVERNFGCSGGELEEFGSFFLIERSNRTPEPLDLGRRCIVILIPEMSDQEPRNGNTLNELSNLRCQFQEDRK